MTVLLFDPTDPAHPIPPMPVHGRYDADTLDDWLTCSHTPHEATHCDRDGMWYEHDGIRHAIRAEVTD